MPPRRPIWASRKFLSAFGAAAIPLVDAGIGLGLDQAHRWEAMAAILAFGFGEQVADLVKLWRGLPPAPPAA